MKNQVFASYEEFLNREDKSVNGFIGFDLMEISRNTNCFGCWNCVYCTNCTECFFCVECINCVGLERIKGLENK